ncbi:MAG: tRNA (adenosine(37)-N6)-threonylcarbamoyltransferase complex ATPase subunit type 1 TsaE [Bacteroidales bacterium]|jgi:tRNA threonylcarbamoyladenosine biosynthesis protein TsaE|nr:tRNA (adenosine(37)-N6)-threonylcarbamoyltransferase complex ATPase subunit type 1 TsaE [Bacteroidales bacterium]
MNNFSIISHSTDETIEIAKKISNCFSIGDIIILEGYLGTGKTHFVKGIAKGLKSKKNVTSPTFNIANFYDSENNQIIHIDLYRIETLEELIDLGLNDYFDNVIVFVEWGEKFIDYFDDYLKISFEKNENDDRIISFDSNSEKYEDKLTKISETLFYISTEIVSS